MTHNRHAIIELVDLKSRTCTGAKAQTPSRQGVPNVEIASDKRIAATTRRRRIDRRGRSAAISGPTVRGALDAHASVRRRRLCRERQTPRPEQDGKADHGDTTHEWQPGQPPYR